MPGRPASRRETRCPTRTATANRAGSLGAPASAASRGRRALVVAEHDPAEPPPPAALGDLSAGGADGRAQPAAAQTEFTELRARLDRAEALVEHAPDAIVILDVD